MANTDFSKYFRFALYDYKSLAIPGLGMINLERNSAFADVENSQVYPPKYDIKFQSDISVNNNQTYDLMRSYIPNLTKADFDSYMSARVAELNSIGQTNIEGVGLLTKNQEGVIFQPYVETTNLLTYGLNKLGLKKISNYVQAKPMEEAKLLPSESSFWLLFLPLLIAALLLATSIFYLNREGAFAQKQKTNKPFVPIIDNDTVKIIADSNSTTTDTNNIFTDTNNITTDTNKFGNDTSTNNNGAINNNGYGNAASKPIVGSEAIVSDIIRNSDGSYIKKCIIITGAYKSVKYRDLMIERLRQKGYDVFSEQKGRLTRVGLQFECHEKDLDAYLQAVRETLEKDAWYLDALANKEG